MNPRRLQRATILSIVAASVDSAAMAGNLTFAPRRTEKAWKYRALELARPDTGGKLGYGGREAMAHYALRPIGHLAAWLLWHSPRVSLLADLAEPRPPQSE